MSKQSNNDRLLPANAKAVAKTVKAAATSGCRAEYRIAGARGLVLHVLPSGTATWYFHYDLVVGRSRKRRKYKIGRLDDLPLARASQEAERLRPLVQQGVDPAGQRAKERTDLTFEDLACERFSRGDPLRPGTRRDYQLLLNKDILPEIGEKVGLSGQLRSAFRPIREPGPPDKLGRVWILAHNNNVCYC